MSVHVLDSKPTTDDAFGTVPDERTLEQRLASGFILVDKPAGPTSHQLAAWARDLLGLEAWPRGHIGPFCYGCSPPDGWTLHENHQQDSQAQKDLHRCVSLSLHAR